MIWLLKYWKGILLAALVAGAFSTGWWKGGDAVQRKWDADTAREVKAQLVKNQEDAAKLKKLEETKNANIVEIDRLNTELGKSERLRLRKTSCRGSSSPSTDNPTGTGVVPEDVPDSQDEALNSFDTTCRNIAYDADKIVESCRVLNDFLK